MKWYKIIGIIRPSLLIFLFFLLLSYRSRDVKWLPDFYMMIAGTALSIVIVFTIIEVWSHIERTKRWEKVKQVMFLRIFLVFVDLYFMIDNYRALIESIVTDKRPQWTFKNVDLSTYIIRMFLKFSYNRKMMLINLKSDNIAGHMRDLANEIKITIQKVKNAPEATQGDKYKKLSLLMSEPNTIQTEEIIYLIEKYKELILKVIELADDEELGLKVQNLERICDNLISSLIWQTRSKSAYFNALITLNDFSLFLRAAADLFELIQEKNKTEKNWKEEFILDLKYWWLPPECWE
ncbi:MAG TPA: hypothetical protein PK564_03080 [bacterium]|jgi:hypothetical protein|nr:hypothetical protein [bacterium]